MKQNSIKNHLKKYFKSLLFLKPETRFWAPVWLAKCSSLNWKELSLIPHTEVKQAKSDYEVLYLKFQYFTGRHSWIFEAPRTSRFSHSARYSWMRDLVFKTKVICSCESHLSLFILCPSHFQIHMFSGTCIQLYNHMYIQVYIYI